MDLMNSIFRSGKFFSPSLSSQVHKIINPATLELIAEITPGSKADVDLAVDAAQSALSGEWKWFSGRSRRDMMYKIADNIQANFDEYVNIEVENVGKPTIDAACDIKDTIELFRFFAGYADKIHGQSFSSLHHPTMRSQTLREPVGVVGMIVAFNYPLLLAAWKIAPALACGNTIVLKPADATPMSTLRLAKTFADVECPAGIFNVVVGLQEVGESIALHPNIDKVSFTGSPGVGKKILEASSHSNLKRVTLELGGKSPVAVFPDADMQLAVEEVFGAVFANMGQNCIAGSRLYLHESIHDRFLDLLKVRIAKVKIGNPSDPSTDFGPLVNKLQFDRVMKLYVLSHLSVQYGLDSPSIKLLCGGKRFGEKGFFVEPTVFYNVNKTDLIAHSEIFGPVLSVMRPFRDIDEMISLANDTEYGLGAGVFSQNIKTIDKFVSGVRAGTVYVNCYNPCEPYMPFGGNKGMSGMGKDMGEAAIEEYTSTKSVYYSME